MLQPLMNALSEANEKVKACLQCGNFDATDPCGLCQDPKRDPHTLCVVEDVSDLWALERTANYRGQYHVLGGCLSALDGIGPEDLRIESLLKRCAESEIQEVILALNATLDGQTTSHYIMDLLEDQTIKVTRLAHGVPVGGELDYIDDGTLIAAMNARRSL